MDTAAAEPSTHVLLTLQRAEVALARAELAAPGAPDEELQQVRYLLGFARLTQFQPGAAALGRPSSRGDVDVTAENEVFRQQVLTELAEPLVAQSDPAAAVKLALEVGERLDGQLTAARAALLDRHGSDFSPADLDAECGQKQLVLVAGGGGGAGWVYVGAGQKLDDAGIVPSYILGSSIGAIYGVLRARTAKADWDGYTQLMHGLDRRQLFSAARRKRRFGLPGLLALRLRDTIGDLFGGDDSMSLSELGIPYESVVAGVRRTAFKRLPRRFRAAATSVVRGVSPLARYSQRSLAPAIATRMWQVAAFFDPRVVKPLIIGSDELTAGFDAVDAAGFSGAVPGVLHYDLDDDDTPMAALLTELFEREQVSALIDGGVASNVPAEQAWRRVRAGKLGTRNALLLAWDCFHPQWDPRHLWLQPITQAVALQHVRNGPFADVLVKFNPTLSPIDLVPEPARFDQAVTWGAASLEPELPLLQKLLSPASRSRRH